MRNENGGLNVLPPRSRSPIQRAGRDQVHAKKRLKQPTMSSGERKIREKELGIENSKLKERENLLEGEIKSMQTKLKYIDNLIKTRAM